MDKKRAVDILVLSDIHLGTYGCHAKELLLYMKSIQPGVVILNGDIIDIWQFSKNYWPKSHMKVIKYLLGWMAKGIRVYYITGNHDEMLRKFEGLEMGALTIVNKMVLPLENGQKAWIFHGDVFDVTMKHSKWLAKLGAIGYDTLIIINRSANFISEKVLGKGRLSISKNIKNGVKSAVSFVSNFTETCAEIGISNEFDYVICGHIHQPDHRVITNDHGSITYLNSGDWVENLTSLEYSEGEWNVFHYYEHFGKIAKSSTPDENDDLGKSITFEELLKEVSLK